MTILLSAPDQMRELIYFKLVGIRNRGILSEDLYTSPYFGLFYFCISQLRNRHD